MDYESGKVNLSELISYISSEQDKDRNEALTRIQLIDNLLFECLGWSKRDDLEVEDAYEGKYADYILSSSRRLLIIEAKREGEYFDLPLDKNRLEYSIPSLSSEFPKLKNALRQALSYCQERGVPFGAVCNGRQIVAFLGARNDGVSPLEGKAIVFPSLEFMYENFHKLWNLLSREGIEHKRLQQLLAGDLVPQLPPKPSASLQQYPGSKGRNTFQADLEILSSIIIEDITSAREIEKEFLEQCYSQSGALSQYSMLSKTILQARYASLFDSEGPNPASVPAVGRRGAPTDIVAQSVSRRPIILIGDVGVGKLISCTH